MFCKYEISIQLVMIWEWCACIMRMSTAISGNNPRIQEICYLFYLPIVVLWTSDVVVQTTETNCMLQKKMCLSQLIGIKILTRIKQNCIFPPTTQNVSSIAIGWGYRIIRFGFSFSPKEAKSKQTPQTLYDSKQV